MGKGINDIQQAMGIKKEEKKREEIDLDDKKEEREVEVEEATTEDAFPISPKDRFYNLIMNSPIVNPADIKMYKLDNGYLFIFLDSLNRAYPGTTPGSVYAFFVGTESKISNKFIEAFTD